MLQNKTKKTDKFSYSMFTVSLIPIIYIRVKMSSFNAVSFSAEFIGTYPSR